MDRGLWTDKRGVVMSRVGRMPIPIPPGVEVEILGNRISVKGPRGESRRAIHSAMKVIREDNQIKVVRPSEDRLHRSLHGLTRTLIANMIEGVTKGFQKILEISGVGYRALLEKDKLILQVGFSHPVELKIPAGVEVKVEGAKLSLKGNDKEQVGEMAAKIKKVRPVEPYKGKGIKYEGEYVKRKAGKAGKVGGEMEKK